MKTIQFTVPGKPVAKQRHRFDRRSNREYTPEETVNYETAVRTYAYNAMGARKPLDGPVSVDICIRLQMPKSWSVKRKREAVDRQIRATKKPDASNVVKAIEDGMNGVVFADDSQIVHMRVEKGYSDAPGVDVCVYVMTGRSAP